MRLLYVLIFIIPLNIHGKHIKSVNAIIGDESFIHTFQRSPTIHDSEDLRIKTHLNFVLQNLQETNVYELSKKQQLNRSILLSHLAKYIEIGNFPKNEFSNISNRPNFIDSNGNICAVGFLIAETIGRETAEHLNAQYQFEYIMNMDSHILDQWLHEYGLSRLEAAMIQPAYGPVLTPSTKNISSTEVGWDYGLLSAGLFSSQAILTYTAHSTRKEYSVKKRYWLSITATTIGAISLYAGIKGFKNSEQNYLKESNPQVTIIPYTYYYEKYPRKKAVSLVNVGAGLFSLVYNGLQAFNYKADMEPPRIRIYSSLQYIPNELDPIPSLSLSYSF